MLLSLLHFSIHADTLELVLEDLHLPPAPLVFSALAQFLNANLQSEAIMMEYKPSIQEHPRTFLFWTYTPRRNPTL